MLELVEQDNTNRTFEISKKASLEEIVKLMQQCNDAAHQAADFLETQNLATSEPPMPPTELLKATKYSHEFSNFMSSNYDLMDSMGKLLEDMQAFLSTYTHQNKLSQ